MAYKKLIKVSNVCQLLDKSKYPATKTINGVTFTNNGDGTITVNGTATARAALTFTSFIKPFLSGKFLLIGCPNGGNVSKYFNYVFIRTQDGNFINGIEDVGNGGILNYGITTYTVLCQIIVMKGTVCDNLVLKPQLFDLTEMYGAGNEPTTVEQFRQDFPNDLYDYSPRCWLTSYKRVFTCKTKNLLSFPYYGQYETKQGITFSKVSTYKVNASGINTGSTGCTFDFNYNKVFKAGTYTIKFYTEGSVPPELYYRIRKDSYYGGTIISDKEFQKTFTLSEDTVLFISFGIYGTMSPQYTGKKINVNVWCQIEKGNTATDYVPYSILPSYQRNLTCKTKNLFDYKTSAEKTQTNNGITLILNADYFELSGQQQAGKYIELGQSGFNIPFEIGKTYVLSADTIVKSGCKVFMRARYTDGENPLGEWETVSWNLYNGTIAKRFTPTRPGYFDKITFYNASDTIPISGDYIIRIQLELGNTVTDYVPYGHL